MTSRLICLLEGGPIYRISASGKAYLFEMHDYGGPLPLRPKDLNVRALHWRHPFWRVVSLWDLQGRRTGKPSADGVLQAIYDDVPLVTPTLSRSRSRKESSVKLSMGIIAAQIPEPVRDGLRHMAALFQSNQAIRQVLGDRARVDVDAAISWVHALSTVSLPPRS